MINVTFRIVLLSAVLTLGVTEAQSLQPRVFYSDLESGPNSGGENNGGAYVTIYGKGFGASQGSSYVTVGGGRASAYPVWTDSKVAFQLGSSAATGSIVLTNASGNSNPVAFTVRPGNIFFVATNGSDSSNGSFASPWQSLLKARDTMKAGDIAYARNGVAQTSDDGQGWNASMLLRVGGSPGLPMAMVAYPGATVTIGNINGPNSGIRSNEQSPGYWVFAGMTLRGVTEAITTYGSTNWRLVGNDLSCPNGDYATACYETSLTSNIQFLGNNVHDAGKATASALYHGVYFSTDSNHVEVGWNTIANVHGCRGLQVHSSPLQGGGASDPTGRNQYDLSIHDNIIHDTQCDGIVLATVDPSKGKVEIYNNVIYNAGKGPSNPENSGNWSCIYVAGYTNLGAPGGGTVEIYNNTLANCGTYANPPYLNSVNAIMNGGHNPDLNVRIRNNIFYQTAGVPYFTIYNATGGLCSETDNCPGIAGSNNLFYGNGPAPVSTKITNSVSANPLFINATSGDFHLAPTSPARRAGVNTARSTDKDGVLRGESPAYDIGAFQVVAPEFVRSDALRRP